MTNYDILKEYEAHKTPIPSYEEWRDLQDDLATCDKDSNNVCEQKEELYEENQQLKELLLKCREKLDWLNGGYDVWGGELTDFIEEIDEVLK